MIETEKIEEMARAMCINSRAWTCRACSWSPIPNCDAYKTAIKLSDAGYHKIPEGAAVLTREEQNKLLEATEYRLNQLRTRIAVKESEIDDLKTELKQARKETAREIFAKIFEDFNIDCGTFSLNMARKNYMNAQVEQTNLALRKRFLQLAKQFGVEVKD